MELINARKM